MSYFQHHAVILEVIYQLAKPLASSSHAANSQDRPRTKLKLIVNKKGKRNPKNPIWLILLLLGGITFFAYHVGSSGKELAPGIIETPKGEITLSPERQAKLEKELEEIDNAEQYVLYATTPREYPCYSCPGDQKTIFLHVGEVWRYGVTRKGERGRYPNQDHGAPDLLYVPQFVGTVGECLKQEKLKIYSYPLLPEAQVRNIVLARPPGNKYDS